MTDHTTPAAPDEDIDGFFSTARTQGRGGVVELPRDGYKAFLFDHDDPHIADYRGMGYEEFTADRQQNQFLRELLDFWDGLYAEPFVGVTSDGSVQEGVHDLGARRCSDDGALVAAAQQALTRLSDEHRARVQYPLDAPDWRGWSNPEFVFHRNGLRLEDLDPPAADALLSVVRASLSPQGHDRLMEAMDLNGYLGDLVDLPTIMNNRSYWFAMFGVPEVGGAWGWQLYGHHAAVNFVTVAGRHVIAPLFLGGEPALSDGERAPLFEARERLALQLASSLTPQQAASAIVYRSVLDPSMPEGRLHPADERHLAGAFRDNRVIPLEGIRATELTDAQRGLLRSIVEDFHLLLIDEQRDGVMEEYDRYVDDTWFAWYGATDGSQPFYFRVQSPVVIAELDHHAGVWLTNRLPARFHVHTTLRHPNGNDYAKAWISQFRSAGAPTAGS